MYKFIPRCSILSHWSICLVLRYHTVLSTIALQYILWSDSVVSPALFFLFKIALAICIEPVDCFGQYGYFSCIILIHEHGMFFCLCLQSLSSVFCSFLCKYNSYITKIFGKNSQILPRLTELLEQSISEESQADGLGLLTLQTHVFPATDSWCNILASNLCWEWNIFPKLAIFRCLQLRIALAAVCIFLVGLTMTVMNLT